MDGLSQEGLISLTELTATGLAERGRTPALGFIGLYSHTVWRWLLIFIAQRW